jgi:hypothetical protein
MSGIAVFIKGGFQLRIDAGYQSLSEALGILGEPIRWHLPEKRMKNAFQIFRPKQSGEG